MLAVYQLALGLYSHASVCTDMVIRDLHGQLSLSCPSGIRSAPIQVDTWHFPASYNALYQVCTTIRKA